MEKRFNLSKEIKELLFKSQYYLKYNRNKKISIYEENYHKKIKDPDGKIRDLSKICDGKGFGMCKNDAGRYCKNDYDCLIPADNNSSTKFSSPDFVIDRSSNAKYIFAFFSCSFL